MEDGSGQWLISNWWGQRTALEKVGIAAIGVGSAIVAATVIAPRLASATVGGGLAAAGGWFLRRGFKPS